VASSPPPPRLEAAPSRLGIYVDGPYRIVETLEGPRVAPDVADFPFLTFACAVGRSFDETVLFGRDSPSGGTEATELLLPPGVTMVMLPPYESLRRLGQVSRATAGTVRGFWRGLSRVDAVWVFGPHPFSFVLVAFALLRRKRVVLGVRQDTHAYFQQRLPSERWKPALLAAKGLDAGFRALARFVRTTVVGEELARRYGGDRRKLLPIGVSLVRDADVVDHPLERDWNGPITLLTVGRIDQEKNPLLLIEALAILQRRRPGRYRLAWAGTGPLADAVLQRARALGVYDRVELLGFVPFGPDLLARYRTAHIFVHVSLTEGVPAVLVEALASGTPVVATAVGGVPAALEHGAAGLLVPPRDVDALVAALDRLGDDAELRDRLAARGLTMARALTLDSQASRIASFIKAADGREAVVA
jgi:glycosyltransferase involved in cell wall biosynthesis